MKMQLIKNQLIIIVVFVFLLLAFPLLKQQLQIIGIDWHVVSVANILLFVLAQFSLLLHRGSLKKANPNAVVLAVMLSTVAKLLIVAIAILIYISVAGKDRNVYGVYASMLLYLIYTFLEVKSTLKMQKEKAEHGH